MQRPLNSCHYLRHNLWTIPLCFRFKFYRKSSIIIKLRLNVERPRNNFQNPPMTLHLPFDYHFRYMTIFASILKQITQKQFRPLMTLRQFMHLQGDECKFPLEILCLERDDDNNSKNLYRLYKDWFIHYWRWRRRILYNIFYTHEN